MNKIALCNKQGWRHTLLQLSFALLASSLAGCSSSTPERTQIQTTNKLVTTDNQAIVDVTELTGSGSNDDELFLADDDDLFSPDYSTIGPAEPVIADPFYYFNVAMFHVNDKLYFWILRPVAEGYKTITPEVLRFGIRNFFKNITMPIRFTNSVLQADMPSAATELGRFAINSTVGVLGLGDPALHYLDWQENDQDLGITLGKYGIANGPYIVWPVFGPSTLRDTIGRTGDYFLSPLTYLRPERLSFAVQAVDKVNVTYFSLGDYEVFKNAYLDPYERMKEFYVEYRAQRIANTVGE